MISNVCNLFFILFLVFLIFKIYLLKKNIDLQTEYFLGTLGHDLRIANLAQIRGLDILQNSHCQDDEHYLIEEINKSSRYMLEMINSLLFSLDKKQSIKNLNYEACNIHNMICESLQFNQQILHKKKLKINTDELNRIEFHADKKAIGKLLNILSEVCIINSEINTTILIKSELKNNTFRFCFSYSGKELSDDECRIIFNLNPRFSTVGFGIKMFLCKKIVEFHNGKIKLNKTKLKQQTFEIELPFHNNAQNK